MAAAVLAQGDDFGGMGGFGGGQSSNPSSMQAGGDSMYPQLQFQHHERTLGLMDSAQQPQLPGRLLQVSDIKPDLQVGLHAACGCFNGMLGGTFFWLMCWEQVSRVCNHTAASLFFAVRPAVAGVHRTGICRAQC
jgi:hypothetical protein